MTEQMDKETREAALQGMGCSRKRKEDARFIQGKGRYTDDIQMSGHAVRRYGSQPLRSRAHQRVSTKRRRLRFRVCMRF